MLKGLRLLFLILIIILTNSLFAVQADRCDYCKRKLEGRYHIITRIGSGERLNICRKCYSGKKCETCSIPLRTSVRFHGHYLCEDCKKSIKFCGLCRDIIEGKYVIGPNYLICSQCNRTKPKCSVCGIAVKPPSGYNGGTKLLCATCSKKAIFCSVCNRAIDSNYIVYETTGKKICPDCVKTSTKCSGCQTPLLRNEGTVVRDKKLCNACVKKTEPCGSCGLLIATSYFTLKHTPGKYCEYCFKNKPHCDMCQRPIGDKFTEYPDTRKICAECSKEVVINNEDVNKVYAEVIDFYAKNLDMKIKNPPPLTVTDVKTLQGLFGTEGTWSKTAELGAFTMRFGGKTDIYILNSLPLPLVYESVAHEAAHAYQYEQNPGIANLEIVEGFAQWAASKMLANKGYLAAIEIMKERKDVYGAGYRKFAEWEEKYGKFTVLGKLKTEK